MTSPYRRIVPDRSPSAPPSAPGALRLGSYVEPHPYFWRLSRIPSKDRLYQVYCDWHRGDRRLVAVVTKQGRLYTLVSEDD